MNRRGEDKRSFALVSALLVLGALTVLIAGFLASMKIERLTARSYLQIAQAQLMALSALNIATGRLEAAVETNRAFVTFYTQENPGYSPVVWIGASNFSGAVPLISRPAGNFESERADSENSTDLNGLHHGIQAAGSLNPASSRYYRAPWEYVTNSSQQRAVGRFAYLIVDDQARVNPRLHLSQLRSWGTSAAEIPPAAHDLLKNRQPLLALHAAHWITPHQIAQAFESAADYQAVKHLTAVYEAPNEDAIPSGYQNEDGSWSPYADAGKPKFNLNDLATNTVHGATPTARAEHIAHIIDRNLPQFKTRDPSFAAANDEASSFKYLHRLAASLVDYIDADTDCTPVNGGEPAGRDLFPMVVALAEQHRWISQNAGPPYICHLQNRIFAQVWNPYTLPVTGRARIEIRNRQELEMGDAIASSLEHYDEISASVTVQPNEMRVIAFPPKTERIVSPSANPSQPAANRPHWAATANGNHPYYLFYWNGTLSDMNRRPPMSNDATSGLGKSAQGTASFAMTVGGPNRWHLNFIPINAGMGENYRSVGDPRANWLCNYNWSTMATSGYAENSRWQGRQADVSGRTQNYLISWAHRDRIRKNPPHGHAPGNISIAPDAVISSYDPETARDAPCYLRNGPMESIGELGHIFDPAQADDQGNASPGGTPNSFFVSGGGRSLRIGQPEFPYWDVPGKRAHHLLDLFTINAATPSGYPEVAGRINVNTAGPEVLAALLENIEINTDEGVPPGHPISEHLLAGILERRPFLSLGDLAPALSNFVHAAGYEPWNNLALGDPVHVMDRAREELLARIINLTTLQSRAFRIYAVGQTLAASGSAGAQCALEAAVEIKVQTTEAGIRLAPVVTYLRFEN
jgi:hypothetical protein